MNKVSFESAFVLGLFALGLICCIVSANSNDKFLHQDDIMK